MSAPLSSLGQRLLGLFQRTKRGRIADRHLVRYLTRGGVVLPAPSLRELRDAGLIVRDGLAWTLTDAGRAA